IEFASFGTVAILDRSFQGGAGERYRSACRGGAGGLSLKGACSPQLPTPKVVPFSQRGAQASVDPMSQIDYNLIEQTRKHINRLVEEIARLSEQDLPPGDYYHEFLQRIQQALAASAGAVWAFTPQGHLQLQFQSNLKQVGVDANDVARQTHGELLRHTVTKA